MGCYSIKSLNIVKGRMSKIALMFPGQGSQTVGMGKDLYEKYSKAKEIIDLAGNDIKDVIFNGPESTLKLTQYAQPAIFTVSMAIFEVFKANYNFVNSEFVQQGIHLVNIVHYAQQVFLVLKRDWKW